MKKKLILISFFLIGLFNSNKTFAADSFRTNISLKQISEVPSDPIELVFERIETIEFYFISGMDKEIPFVHIKGRLTKPFWRIFFKKIPFLHRGPSDQQSFFVKIPLDEEKKQFTIGLSGPQGETKILTYEVFAPAYAKILRARDLNYKNNDFID